MKIRLLQTALALSIAFMAWIYLSKKQKVHGECFDYNNLDVVEVVAGTNQGATGTVFGFIQDIEGECLYKVRGQRGVEMPFVEWYESWELSPAPED